MIGRYAALAEMALRDKGEVGDLVAGIISRAQHFAVPDSGYLFNDGLRGLVGAEIHLPFPETTIEYDYPNSRRVIIAHEVGLDIKGVVMYCAFDLRDGAGWRLAQGMCSLPKDATAMWCDPHPDRAAGRQFVGGEIRILNGCPASISGWTGDYIAEERTTLLEFLEALSCRNVTAEVFCDSRTTEEKNERRRAAGKTPLYVVKRLVVVPPHSGKFSESGTGDRAPVKQHLRRGHIRRLPSGNYWVNACVVGSPDSGVIENRYDIRAA